MFVFIRAQLQWSCCLRDGNERHALLSVWFVRQLWRPFLSFLVLY